MTPDRRQRLLERQAEGREDFLSFVHDVVKVQRRRGRAHLGENPLGSAAWKEPMIQAAYEDEYHGKAHMCSFGLKRPDTREPLKKPTGLAGAKQITEACSRTCSCTVPHGETLGACVTGNHRYSVAEFAGYTKSFARQVVLGAERFLDEWTPHECRAFTVEEVPEERFMEVDEPVPEERDLFDQLYEEEDSKMPPPKSEEDGDKEGPKKPVKEVVEKLRQTLGHPSKSTVIQTLKLGGAPKEVLSSCSATKSSISTSPTREACSFQSGGPCGLEVRKECQG